MEGDEAVAEAMIMKMCKNGDDAQEDKREGWSWEYEDIGQVDEGDDLGEDGKKGWGGLDGEGNEKGCKEGEWLQEQW